MKAWTDSTTSGSGVGTESAARACARCSGEVTIGITRLIEASMSIAG